MAACYGPSVGRASLGGGSGLQQVFLPNGACGFRDLSVAGKAPTCGCRRFWLNSTHNPDQESERAWCFCGHHACFHDHVQAQNAAQRTPSVFPSSHQANATYHSGGFVAPTWSELIADAEHTNTHSTHQADSRGLQRPATTGLGIQHPQPESQQGINVRLWQALTGFAREQDNGGHSGDTSKLPSTAVPSVYDEPKVATPTHNFQAQPGASRPMGPPVTIPPATNPNQTDEYSATEVATPSVRGTPDFRALAAVPLNVPAGPSDQPSPRVESQNAVVRRPQPCHPSHPTPSPSVSIGPALSIQEMCNTIQDYGRRISILESLSFSHMPSDVVQDKFDLMDARVLDLEQWRTDQDRLQAVDDTGERLDQANTRIDDLEHWRSQEDNVTLAQQVDAQEKNSNKRRRLPFETSSFASDESFDKNAAAQTEAVVLATLAATAETGPRIDALESRIADLEDAALPSINRPWHVQVVLLPFGRQLPGIWFSARESTQHSIRSATQMSEEWTGAQSAAKSSFQSTASGGWTTESIEVWNKCVDQNGEWLSPKACGPNGTVFQRLAGRGLVREIHLQAPDARHICNSISDAFRDVLRGSKGKTSSATQTLQALRERFIPLRKVRKSTRLRFLSPAEMTTSAIWDASFLESSVFMKVNDGERRLYLTTPEGYTQPQQPGWSWSALRDLPAYDIDGELQAAQNYGSVVEACWTYHDRLDQSSSLQSSFNLDGSSWSDSNPDSDHGEDDHAEENLMLSPSTSRHSHVRSLSLPSSALETSLNDVETVPKRRVASFELEPSVSAREYSPEYITKRRRISSSPELERRGVNFTPRWSREPPSPYTVDDAGQTRPASGRFNRGTTPFAYATPHSHFDSRGDDGDTEIDDTDVPVGDDTQANDPEEWEGVQEGSKEEVEGNCYDDDDNLDDGVTIYEV